jgi:hypothetical protein
MMIATGVFGIQYNRQGRHLTFEDTKKADAVIGAVQSHIADDQVEDTRLPSQCESGIYGVCGAGFIALRLADSCPRFPTRSTIVYQKNAMWIVHCATEQTGGLGDSLNGVALLNGDARRPSKDG